MIKKSFILVLLAFSVQFIAGQQLGHPLEGPEVGIVENIGRTLPGDIMLTNTEGREQNLLELIDKPTVLVFVYFRCPVVCTRVQEGIAELVNASNLVIGEDYQVITISFDPTDGPSDAKKEKAKHAGGLLGNEQKHWIYLTGDPATLDELTNQVGFYFKETGRDFIHPTGIMITDKNGQLVRYLYDNKQFRYKPIDLKLAVNEASRGRFNPLNLAFKFNYHYKSYSLDVIATSAMLILPVSLLILILLFLRKKKK